MGQVINARPIEILLVEDSMGDIYLTKEALKDAKICNNLNVVNDGIQAMAYLTHSDKYASATVPDLILLDLNMPRMDGRETLSAIKADEALRHIPVVVFTTSDADTDVLESYQLNANCFITKPMQLDRFIEVIRSIEHFWLNVVTLPRNPE